MICRLQQLNIRNYIVASFDTKIFEYCRKKVILSYPIHENLTFQKLEHAEFGSTDFRKLTKMKSSQVLKILNEGYNVLWSDLDIFFLKNPFDYFNLKKEEFDIYIQSNAPPTEVEDNGYRRINSGFYFVKASNRTRKAFQQIVAHAESSNLSEQPSFYTILCGDNGEFRDSKSSCYNGYVSTKFLPRTLFPNGAMIWNSTISLDKSIIVHTNWISGLYNKLHKMLQYNWWVLSNEGKCIYRII